MYARFIEGILDFFIPPRCLMCGISIQKSGSICSKCFKKLTFIVEPCCQKCGAPFLYDSMAGIDHLCLQCHRESLLWHRGKAAFLYNEGIKRLILPLKYADQHNGLDFLAHCMWQCAASLLQEVDYLIPVPLHKKRLQQRHYNQSALLAWKLNKKAKKTVLPLALRKIRNTPSLGHYNKEDRQTILQGAFAINPDFQKVIRYKSVVLIDDVMTTGSTLNACSQVLLDAGVKQINSVVIAKVGND